MPTPRYPSLYQINTRVWLTELSRTLGRPTTLDDIPDSELDRLAGLGFDWVWLLSVWQTGHASQIASRTKPEWRKEFEETLPDLREEDITGSGFAITAYNVHQDLGGDEALARLRSRLASRGIQLMLDFVPNHVALDHPWVDEHPEYFIAGSEQDLLQSPQNYTRVDRPQGNLVLAHGRDPYFPGWSDTLQLNYAHPQTQEAMRSVLCKIATQCDGVRCDMAMLVLPEIFARTWNLPSADFWPNAIAQVKTQVPGFCFLAEVYWDLEWTLQQQGFDYTYDKRLYDRLCDQKAKPIREHLLAGLDYQTKLAHFLENHDEQRAAATFPPGIHEAAAVLTYLSPGMRFFHRGQFEGHLRRISPHLCRGPLEAVNATIASFYDQLLAILRQVVVREGQWQLLKCLPAWDGNKTHDEFIAYAWHGPQDERLIVTVNYSPHQSQCHVRLPFADWKNATWTLHDSFHHATYERSGDDLQSRGLFLDDAPWKAAVYTVKRRV